MVAGLNNILYKKSIMEKSVVVSFFLIMFICSVSWSKKQEKVIDYLTGIQIINNLKVKADDFLTLTWTKPSMDSTSITYHVYRSSSSEGPWLKLNSKPVVRLKFVDYSTNPGNYYYMVQVEDKVKNTYPGVSNVINEKFSPYSSGQVLTSTPFRNLDPRRGLNIDFLLAYYIGRLYGENLYGGKMIADIISPINFLLFSSDIKLVLETERDWPISWAAGYKYTFLFASKKLAPGQSASLSFQLGQETGSFGSAYAVIGKSFLQTSVSAGFIQGEDPRILQFLSEYLYNRLDWKLTTTSAYFSIDTRIIPTIRLKIEAVHPLDNPLDPWLIHTNLGQILKTNFDIAFIKYIDGYDIIGGFWYRFTLIPRDK